MSKRDTKTSLSGCVSERYHQRAARAGPLERLGEDPAEIANELADPDLYYIAAKIQG